MSYKAKFTGWDSLDIKDLLVAYRKAKADCFYENSVLTAIKFAKYEKNLLRNIKILLKKLKNNAGLENNEDLSGGTKLLPKKISIGKKNKNSHIHFSKPDRAVENLFKNYNATPEFRIVGDFPVDTHIISALWINMIGHQFDAKFSDSCYGSRLKRFSNDDLSTKDSSGPFNITSIGSFEPYIHPYQKWRRNGLNAIRDELEKDRDIIAISLDLKSYYSIDPLALSNKNLLQELNLELSYEELDFTNQLARLLKKWSDIASTFEEEIGGDKKKQRWISYWPYM